MKIKNLRFKIGIRNSLLIILSAYFIFFVFFDLNWGAPYYFHPDERNIASSITQLNFTSNLNPHFFAYGQLPIYTVYFLGVISNFFTNNLMFNPHVSFENAILIGRILSSCITILLVYLIYKTTTELKNKNAGIIAFILSATSVAFFQFSHFSTFEIWLSFFYLLSSFELFHFIKTKKIIHFALASIFFGVSCGLKSSSVTFIIVPIFVIFINSFDTLNFKNKVINFLKHLLILLCLSAVFYLITSPFNVTDSNSFIHSMKYESGVATGTLPVFYTGSFNDQLPVIFHIQRVLPFLINPLILLIFVPALFYLTIGSIKNRDKILGIFLLSFFITFASGAFLFTKWTRYIVPAIPFIYILLGVFMADILKNKKLFNVVLIILASAGIVFSFSYIKSVRLDLDSQLAALNFAQKNIPQNSKILSEVYDIGIVPFNPYYDISLFNFYDLDNGDFQKQLLPGALKVSNFIILPSQRIYESRINHPQKFPQGHKFYTELFSNKTDFVKIYQTPCDIFCKITYLGDPVFNVEQTTNVFDRPNVFIFKRQSMQ